MTAKAFGALVGVSGPMICEYELGTRRPSLEKAIQIEAVTGGFVPVEEWGHSASALLDIVKARSKKKVALCTSSTS